MSFRLVAVFSSLLLVSAASAAYAQFQEPTKEELQMTAEPKAPGAAAVYLYREEKVDALNGIETFYQRIKVLTEKGKEAATVRIPHIRGVGTIEKIQGRTIHKDGTVIPLTAKPEDLVDYKTKGYQLNTITFSLPGVEVGSILEYRVEVHDYRDPQPGLDLQDNYFIEKAHYAFRPAEETDASKVGWTARAGMPVHIAKAKGWFTWDMESVPAMPNEDWMPPLKTVRWRVEFYDTPFKNVTDYWKMAGGRWAVNMDEWTEPSKSLKEAVAQLVSPKDTDAQKARKLYDVVQNMENTDYTRVRSKAELKGAKLRSVGTAEDAWREKRGDSFRLALLYVALARAAGLKVYAMQVVDRDRGSFDKSFLSTWQLDSVLAMLIIDGKEVVVDPGEKLCPYGQLHWSHSLAGGLMQAGNGNVAFTFTPTSNYSDNTEERIGEVEVHADGSATGMLRYVMRGQLALDWRQKALGQDDSELKKQFNEMLRDVLPQGMNAEFQGFEGLNNPYTDLVANVSVTGNLATVTGKHIFLPALFFEVHRKHPFLEGDQRLTPVDVEYPRRILEQITYKLPNGYTVESAPQAASIPWPQNAAMAIASKKDGNSVQVQRQLVYSFTLVDPSHYDGLHAFYQKVATADQQQIVLSRTNVVASAN